MYYTNLEMRYCNLEDNQNLTEIVRTEFDTLLKSKDAITQDLQVKLSTAKQLKERLSQEPKHVWNFPLSCR